ncbi:MAG: HI0074 family nucleotidyltransferase substrate-binding subunit [bacterium]
MENLSLLPIKKAQQVFEKFRVNLNSDQEKAGAVQAFEFCYEMSWKIMRRVLELRGLEVGSPKDTFRKAHEEGLIKNPEIWFEFQKIRNIVTHTYNEKNLDIIVKNFDSFSAEMQKLIEQLEHL